MSDELKDALNTLRNPGGGVKLVSHGWVTPRTYNCATEAALVCNAIGSKNGNMTVASALREAYEAGRKGWVLK